MGKRKTSAQKEKKPTSFSVKEKLIDFFTILAAGILIAAFEKLLDYLLARYG